MNTYIAVKGAALQKERRNVKTGKSWKTMSSIYAITFTVQEEEK